MSNKYEFGLIINNVKYILLQGKDIENLKKESLEDNIYFTLRDIFFNADNVRTIDIVNDFNRKLTNNICYEIRKSDFRYSNILSNEEYVKELLNFLHRINENYFIYNIVDDISEINLNNYMKINDWLNNLNNIKSSLEQIIKNR